jgi:hydroxyacylglutathione hydrolase
MLKVETYSLGPLQTNAYVLYKPEEQRCIIIDPGMNPQALIRKVKDWEVEAILLTHAHFDHIGGVDELRKLKNCPVYLHDAEAEWLTNPKKNGSLMWSEVTTPISSDPAEYGLDHNMQLKLLGETFKVYHTPGHSPGSVSFHLDNMLFGGDVLFRQSVGRTDLPGGSSRELYNSIQTILFKLDDQTVVYPGHGPRTTIGYEKVNNPHV